VTLENVSVLRNACALVVLLITACLVAGCGLPEDDTQAEAAEAPERPNVILILTDDQTLQDAEYMPNVQRLLAEEGVTFENAFVTDPLCCPSRATILRGQYAHNHQILGNALPRGGHKRFEQLGRQDSTAATWLQDDGYRTALIGKYMNDYSGTYVPPGWDDWQAISGNYLSDDLNENGRIVTYDPERYHLDDVLAEKAVSYVDSASDSNRAFFTDDSPFFMWVGTKAPHQPATPAPRHEDEFEDLPLPNGPSFDEEDVSDKPQWVRDNPPLSDRKSVV
jgi:N-acetylglucosamine-6-sulfatase